MSSTVARAILLFLGAAPAVAAPASTMRHPRAPDQPLPVRFRPWYCSRCLKQGRIEAGARDLEFMGEPLVGLAKRIGLPKRGWHAIETPNFRILSTLKGARVGLKDSRFSRGDLEQLKAIFPRLKAGGFLDSHQRAHLYHLRLERLYAHFAALTNNRKKWLGMPDRWEVYLFEKQKRYRVFAKEILGRTNQDAPVVRYHHPAKRNHHVLTTAAQLFKNKDRNLANAVAHHIGHQLVNGHHNFHVDVWAWLEAGCAHFYERSESEKSNYFCRPGDEAGMRGDWRKKIRKAVAKGRIPSLGSWCAKLQPNQLDDMEHAVSWSIVDWLVRSDPVRFGKLLDRANDPERKPTAAQAIREVYGVAPDVLHDRWRKHVLDKY